MRRRRADELDSDDRLIAGALSDMEEQMPEVDLLPGVYAKLSAHRKHRPLRMALAAAIAAALLITGCAAALGGLDWIGEMMNGLGFTDVVEPVDYSVTDEGIEFGVLGARRYGSAAVFYVTARDTLGRGRTAEDADGMSHLVWASGSTVNASFSVDGYSQHFVRLVSYDEETQTAAYEITAVFEDMPVPDELTVRLRGYNISYENISELPIEIDVGAAASGEHLTEGAELLAFRRGGAVPDTGLSFGALGAIGGKLTVQLWYSTGGEFTRSTGPIRGTSICWTPPGRGTKSCPAAGSSWTAAKWCTSSPLTPHRRSCPARQCTSAAAPSGGSRATGA